MPFTSTICALLLSFSAQGPYEIPGTCHEIRSEINPMFPQMCPTQEHTEHLNLLKNKHEVLKCNAKQNGDLQSRREHACEEVHKMPLDCPDMQEMFLHKVHCPELTAYLIEHGNDNPTRLSPQDDKLLLNIKAEANRLKCQNHYDLP